ncbi:ectonucleoside triphosphate diphosphohydrolase 4 isoform X2 [Leucoraja erinacea]|uniref:ectonucleoside triphosphate diphosphohydrolase 4 isoform X2 n=1 Tax=Leucoraja erinaceus TaxID=7782 RepID=UPI00245441D4|nr:ectonucleoside triphosphate diphosphohydrolase 4 isoform X2 [Leucoraja erinacea]
MGRFCISCLFPASWHFSLSPSACPRPLNTTYRQLTAVALLTILISLLYILLVLDRNRWGRFYQDNGNRYLTKLMDMEATDIKNPYLNYGVVIDCGSSGSRLFVYCWPRHNGNPHDLLDIKQMRGKNSLPVVMKIKPGISDLASTPEKASDYLAPLLNFAADHIPHSKHQETPLYILCTAGMRIVPENQQNAILEDLRTDIPLHYDFLFADSHAEVISGKQEGVYAWIGINFVLGRFNHISAGEDSVVKVNVPGTETQAAVVRKRTTGVLDMGGVSTQIAYEVPKTVSFASSQQEEVAKNLLAEFNLGCDAHHTDHVYRVYVTTFLGFGGNAARKRYEEQIVYKTTLTNRLLGQKTGTSEDIPYLDPCLPVDIKDEIHRDGQTVYLRGLGDFDWCREVIFPLLNKTNETSTSISGIYQPPLDYRNSEFYGFSEFFYCTEDVLRMGGGYKVAKFTKAAKDYCATKWPVLKERFDRRLYSSHADLHRLKYQCFKSAWMYEVLHRGFSFPVNYTNLKTAQLVYDKEVQWTLGAILYRTRYLPLRDIQQDAFKGNHTHWRGFSFVYNHYLFFVCFLVVLLSIFLYLLRLRRIHRRMLHNTSPAAALWMTEGGLPQITEVS